jgi:hypothetical protein
MGAGFGDFRFQGPMPSFQFRKMRFYGHVGGFSSGQSCLNGINYTLFGLGFEAGFDCAAQQSPSSTRRAGPRLERNLANGDTFPHFPCSAYGLTGTGHRGKSGVGARTLCGGASSKSAVAMTEEEERELRLQLARLQQEHRDLDAAISALQHSPGSDLLQVQRLKKRKLHLRDRISHIEDQLTPDIIA